jgi:hypothetical protein
VLHFYRELFFSLFYAFNKGFLKQFFSKKTAEKNQTVFFKSSEILMNTAFQKIVFFDFVKNQSGIVCKILFESGFGEPRQSTNRVKMLINLFKNFFALVKSLFNIV